MAFIDISPYVTSRLRTENADCWPIIRSNIFDLTSLYFTSLKCTLRHLHNYSHPYISLLHFIWVYILRSFYVCDQHITFYFHVLWRFFFYPACVSVWLAELSSIISLLMISVHNSNLIHSYVLLFYFVFFCIVYLFVYFFVVFYLVFNNQA